VSLVVVVALGAVTPLMGVVGTAAADHEAAVFDASGYTSSGDGSHSVSNSGHGVDFTYDLGDQLPDEDPETWTFEKTAGETKTLEFDWSWSGCHSFYQTDGDAYVYAKDSNGKTEKKLVDTDGCTFSESGTDTIDITDGYTFGIKITGYHYDSKKSLDGTFSMTPTDDTAPTFDSVSKVDETTITATIADNHDVDETTISKSDFSLTAGTLSSISTIENGANTDVTLTLDSAVDTDSIDVSIAGSIDDLDGNSLTSGTKTVTGMDGVAPTVDSAARVDDTTIDVDLSDSGSGIDKSSIGSGDFTLDSGSISSIDTSSVTDGGTGTQTVSINLGSQVDDDRVTVSLQSDGIDDKNGNTQTSGSADATGMDGVAPTLDSATRVDDTTIDVDLSDGGAGIEKSSIDSGDFSLDTGTISSIDRSGVTDGGTGTQTVTINFDSAVDDDTVTVSLQSDGIDDKNGNTRTSGSEDASNMDGVAPTLNSAARADDTTIDVDLSDSGSGIDKSSIGSGDFSLDTGTISSIDTSGVTDGGTGTQTVTINLDSAVDSDAVTVSLQSDGIDDKAGNTQTSGSADASNMDGVAPTLDSASKVDDTTIDVDLSDSGSGIDKSTIGSDDFSLDSGSISSIDTSGVTDGGTGPQTVTITLASAVDDDTVTVSLQSDGIDDKAGNTRTTGSADATGMDGVAPTLDSATRVDDTTIDVDLSDSGSGIDKSSIGSGDFSLDTGTVSSIDTSGVTDGGTGTQTVTIDLVAAVDTDTVTVSLQSDGIDDKNGNTLTSGSADATGMDGVAPSFTGTTLAGDNSYVDVTFSEGVYGSDGSSALTAGDLTATATQNGGAVSSATVSTLTKTDGSGLVGGETTVRVHLSLTGTPADGVESVEIQPADGSSVADDDTNLLAGSDSTGSVTLNDRTAPSLSSDSGTTDEDTSTEIVADLLSNDDDQGALSVTKVDGSTNNVGSSTTGDNGGQFTIASDGTVDFDPNGEFESLSSGDSSTTKVTVTVSDSAGNTNTQTVTATVTGVNDAPTLSTDARSLNSIDEDDTATGGTTVSAVLGSAGSTGDLEGETLGVAVTGVDDTDGTWEYSTDGGSSWQTVASASPADDSALLLANDDHLRFVPDDDISGKVGGSVTLRAWDGTSGSAGDTGADASTTGGTTAYSSNPASASITVDDAPDVSSIDRATGESNPTNADSVEFTVTFSESVGGVDSSDFTLTTTDSATTANGDADISVAGSGGSYTVTVANVEGDGTLGVTLDDDDTITADDNGVALGGAGTGDAGDGSDTSDENFTVDNTVPSVSGVSLTDDTDGNGLVANGDSLLITATVTDANGVASVETDASAFDAGTVTLSDDGPNSAAGDDRYSATVSVGASPTEGDQSVSISATDAAGNGGSQAVASGTVTVDTTAPAVSSVTLTDDTDGNGVVIDGEKLLITATVTDANGVASVETDASAFDAGTVTLSDDGPNSAAGDDRYSATVTVGASPTEGDQSVSVNATDTVGNGGSQAADSGNISVDTTAPSLTGDKGSTGEGGAATIVANLLGNDDDATALSVTKVDGSASNVGSRVVGGSGGLFTIASDGTVDFDPNGEFESLASDESATTQVTVTVADAAGNTDTQTVTATIDGVNDAPTGIRLTGTTVEQSAGTDAVVGRLAATDVDDEDHAFSLVSGSGDEDNDAFTIVQDDLRADNASALAAGSYDVRVAAADGDGGTVDARVTVTVIDDRSPTITSSTPADDATGVIESTDITITFSEPIAFESGTVTLRADDGGFSDWETFDVRNDTGSGDGTLSISGSRIRIDPSTDLAGATTYAVRIDAGALTDTVLSTNEFGGIADDTTLRFTTIDSTAPTASAGSNVTVVAGESVSFDGSNSTDDVDIVSYEWDFDDGETDETGPTPAHPFAKAGTYEVELTVADDAGNTDTDTVTVTAEALGLNAAATEADIVTGSPLTVDVTASRGDRAFTATLSDARDRPVETVTGTLDPDGTGTVNFGAENITAGSGPYTVAVVDDASGATAATGTVTVTAANADLDTDPDGDMHLRAASKQTIAGETNVAPGTQITVRVRGSDTGSPFIEPLETSVEADGTFVASGDFSHRAAGTNYTIEVRQDGTTLSDTVEGRFRAGSSASVTFDDQGSDGQSVTVDSVTTSDGGFVAIHRDDAAGDIVGTSDYVESGSESNVEITLDEPLTDSAQLTAVVHQDDGDSSFNVADDEAYTEAGSAVADTANITFEEASDATTATAEVTPRPQETTTPSVETTTPSVETTAPGETTTPSVETTAPGETTAPPEETPPGETTAPPGETTATTSGDGPGFGLLVALVALLAAALLGRRRS